MERSQRGVRGPSRTKRRAILDAALQVFLESGFGGAKIEDVAAAADVSKQTIYAHFGGGEDGVKEALFRAMVERSVGRSDDSDGPAQFVDALGATDDLVHDLTALARHHLRLVMTPELLRLRRILIGEAQRFPDLAATWYENGPRRSFDAFAAAFTMLGDRGLLDLNDPMVAAQTFNWLVLSSPLNYAMAHPDATWDGADLDAVADEAVRVFLAGYGTGHHR